MTPTTARVIYPDLPDPLTPGDLQQLFSPSFDERKWAPTVTRTVESQVALLVQLKSFQTIGRFLPVANIPLVAIEYMARRMSVGSGSNLIFPDRTLYRHRQAILKRLEVVSWGTEARALTQATMQSTAQARTDPADIINSAIDALIRHDFELPPLATLRRLAGTAHRNINAAQWTEVCGRLSSAQQAVLETCWPLIRKRRNRPLPICAHRQGVPHEKISMR